jgi:hypothetical protein
VINSIGQISPGDALASHEHRLIGCVGHGKAAGPIDTLKKISIHKGWNRVAAT